MSIQACDTPQPQLAVPALSVWGGLARVMRRHFGAAALTTGLTFVIAAAAVFSITPLYRASVLVALETRDIRFSDNSAVTSSRVGNMDANIARSEAEILGSEGIARQVIKELDLVNSADFAAKPSLIGRARSALTALLEPAGMKFSAPAVDPQEERTEATVAAYRKAVTVFNDGRSYVMTLNVQVANRALAAAIANRHVDDYVGRQRAAKEAALGMATKWLDREVQDLSVRLQDAEMRVQAYREEHRLFSARGTPVAQQQLADLGGELAKARADVAMRNARAQQARASGLGRQLESEATVAQLRATELANIVSEMETKLARNERDEAGARDLERDASATRELYESLLSRQKQVAAQEGAQLADAQIVSRAVAPVTPAFPNKPLFLVAAAMVAGVAGLGMALLLERRYTGLGTRAEAESELGIRVLAMVPRTSRHSPFADAVSRQPRSEAAEAIRTLRSVLATGLGGMPKVMAVTSALPGEGKTSVALALARSLAGSGLHVLLIEADLRRGQIGNLAWASGEGAVAERSTAAVLLGEVELTNAVRSDKASGLQVLAATRRAENPQDLLDRDRLARLVAAARAGFDYVLIDTPPVAAVSDALMVAREVDATLLVVRAEETPAATVAGVIRTFREASLPLAGVVLTASDPDRTIPGGMATRRLARAYLEG